MNRALIELIISHANVAASDNFPGQKNLLREQAIRIFDLMCDEQPETVAGTPVIIWPDLLEDVEWEEDDANRREDQETRFAALRGVL